MKMTTRFTLMTALCVVSWLATHAGAQQTCKQGFVWREAYQGDTVCVTPATRTQTAEDNRQADARREPGGGAYGPNTCRSGYVWREAREGDVVCVTPEVRSQAAADNAAAASRVVATPAVPGTVGRSVATSRISGAAQAATSTYKLSDWSGWMRKEGVQYRYRWGIDPTASKYATNIDALFEIRNMTTTNWEGAVRSLDCANDTLSMSKRVVLKPNELQSVSFMTPNCGTKTNPSFKPNVVKSVRIDN
jgi:hypothetical protein